VNELFVEWPYNWYGIWDFGHERFKNFPKVEMAIDVEWAPTDINDLATYLQDCPIASTTGLSVPCLLCDKSLAMCYQSDGEWLWPCGLQHYLTAHSVVLPSRFVNHIRNRDYSPPRSINQNIEDLPWPEGFAIRKQRESK